MAAITCNASLDAATDAERARPARLRDDPGPPAARMAGATDVRFGPVDPDIVSEAIPAFFIGRNADGFWVVRERNGLIGGIFFLKTSALSFARMQAGEAGCATIFPAERFELDITNNGNRLAGHIAPLMRLTAQLWRRIDNAR